MENTRQIEATYTTTQAVMRSAISDLNNQQTIKIGDKDYNTVAVRVNMFRKHFPDWSIDTVILNETITDALTKRIVMKTYIRTPAERVVATGIASEVWKGRVNTESAVENCETSAVGRCLANAGFGTEESIASAEEVANAIHQQEHRIPNKALAR